VTGAAFPTTRGSMVEAMTSPDAGSRRAAFAALVAVYWRPVYFHLRMRWAREPADAEDLTQEFFTAALAGDFFAGYDPARARFRTFLRLCCNRFAARSARDARRLKRGGGAVHLPLDFAVAEAELAATGPGDNLDPAARFDAETVRSLLGLAVDDLREQCRQDGHMARFTVFERYDLVAAGAERPTYRELADALSLPVTQVTNHLAWARRAVRRLALERLRALCGSEAEYREEARALFGAGAA
jgi:DNA-directed RNA polymerase specialized sigma24 family protein